MNLTSRPAAAVAAFALSALAVLLIPSGAAAHPVPIGATKAGVEHAEQQAGVANQGEGLQQQSPSSPSGDTGAAAWQLALSVAFGATLTGGVVLASRQVSHHRHVVAP